MVTAEIGTTARLERETDSNLYLAQGFFQVLKNLHRDLDHMLPMERHPRCRLQELKKELLTLLAAHHRERNLPDMLHLWTDLVAGETRGEIENRVAQFPLQLREALRLQIRQHFISTGEIDEVEPIFYLQRMGRVMGEMVRRYYLRVYAEGLDAGLVRPNELPWSEEHFRDQWSELQEEARRSQSSLGLSAIHMERMRLIENLARQVCCDWGEVHPLVEGFADSFHPDLIHPDEWGVGWDRMVEDSRNLERVRRMQRDSEFPDPNMGRFSTMEAGGIFFDPTSSFITTMPEAIRTVVFGDLEMLGHQFAAAPEFALASRLAEIVLADQGRSVPQDILDRGITTHDLHRSATWIRTKMVELYRRNRTFNDRLLEYYFAGVAEASLLPVVGEFLELPTRLTGRLAWRPDSQWEPEGPVVELQTRGRALGYALRLATLEMLHFGEAAGLFDLATEGLDRQVLNQFVESEGITVGDLDFSVDHLQAILALDRFALRVHYQWGNYHPLLQGFCENFPEHDILGPQARLLRSLRDQVEAYLRQVEEPH